MTSTKLKNMFPGFWKEVYDLTYNDIEQSTGHSGIPIIDHKLKDKISHNVTFNACYALYSRLNVE